MRYLIMAAALLGIITTGTAQGFGPSMDAKAGPAEASAIKGGVSVRFRLIETAAATGLERAVDPKTGAEIYLRPEAAIENADIKEARVILDEIWRLPVVAVELKAVAKEKFSSFTASNAGRWLAIVVDGTVVNTVQIRERIASGECIISGSFTAEQAERIATGIFLFQETPPADVLKSPEDVVRDYFSAVKTDLSAIGRFMHPEALASFRDMLLPLLETESVRQIFFGEGATMETVRQASPLEFFHSFMLVASALWKTGVLSAEPVVIGSVAEGDLIHVLARLKAELGGISVSKYEVISLKRHGGQWKLLLSGKFEGLAGAFRMQVKTMQGRSSEDETAF